MSQDNKYRRANSCVTTHKLAEYSGYHVCSSNPTADPAQPEDQGGFSAEKNSQNDSTQEDSDIFSSHVACRAIFTHTIHSLGEKVVSRQTAPRHKTTSMAGQIAASLYTSWRRIRDTMYALPIPPQTPHNRKTGGNSART